MRRGNTYKRRVSALQHRFPYLCPPLRFRICILWGWSGWVQAGQFSCWSKLSASVIFMEPSFTARCLGFFRMPTRNWKCSFWLGCWAILKYFGGILLWSTLGRSKQVAGKRRTKDELSHRQLFCPLSHNFSLLAVEILTPYCFKLFAAFPSLSS